jgi:protein gp37
MGKKGYENGFKFTILPERVKLPLTVKKPTRFFVNSMSDLFHEEMPFEFLDQIFETIKNTPKHIYQILTKRENILQKYFCNHPVPDNVWLGVTVENKEAKKRIDILKTINAPIRFLSIEPLLDDVGQLDLSDIDWVIVGGESGPGARPMQKQWVLDIKDQCDENKVPFFFKQWGGANKKQAGRTLLDQTWDAMPNSPKGQLPLVLDDGCLFARTAAAPMGGREGCNVRVRTQE